MAAITSLIIGATLGALTAGFYVCCRFSEELAELEAELNELNDLSKSCVPWDVLEDIKKNSITLPDLMKILRSELISVKRKDKVAASWNGALEAVRWQVEEHLGVEHRENL